MTRDRKVDELARIIGVTVDGPGKTLEAFDHEARLGRDPDFGKGSFACNLHQSGALHGPIHVLRQLNPDRFMR